MNLGAFMDPEFPIFSTTLCYLEREDAYLKMCIRDSGAAGHHRQVYRNAVIVGGVLHRVHIGVRDKDVYKRQL